MTGPGLANVSPDIKLCCEFWSVGFAVMILGEHWWSRQSRKVAFRGSTANAQTDSCAIGAPVPLGRLRFDLWKRVAAGHDEPAFFAGSMQRDRRFLRKDLCGCRFPDGVVGEDSGGVNISNLRGRGSEFLRPWPGSVHSSCGIHTSWRRRGTPTATLNPSPLIRSSGAAQNTAQHRSTANAGEPNTAPIVHGPETETPVSRPRKAMSNARTK